jgi:hypothetical protein
MQYSADVNYNGGTRVDFGIPLAAGTTNISTGGSVAAAGSIDLSSVVELPDPYGRTIVVALSGAGTGTLTINGYDYLGQPISEAFTLAGATPVVGVKAFKSFRNASFPVVGAVTLNVGTGAKLGLPYKALRVQFETANGVFTAAGTLTAPVLTDPATAVSGDPRGTYTPTTTPNGVITAGVITGTAITAVFDMVNDVNAAGNGGLHGIQQFAA